jgi:NADH-quinone oxidoreductase subunit L
MEGPTPVSALIHAATMVTAGIYMIARSHAIFNLSPHALQIVAIIGCITAIFAATMGLAQTDIKRVLAYSTVSQLGYMFLACGVAAYSAGIFHLMTHAFFKALLFLGAGSVIHAVGGEQDMRRMGGLRKLIPWTFWVVTIATIAIAGIPPFAGFFSKDEILGAVFHSPYGGPVIWGIGVLTAGLTSFYMCFACGS